MPSGRAYFLHKDVACVLVVFELGLCGAELSQVITPDFFDLLAGDADPIFAEVILANTFCEIAGFSSWAKHTGYLS
jgi:hypothetical protein